MCDGPEVGARLNVSGRSRGLLWLNRGNEEERRSKRVSGSQA